MVASPTHPILIDLDNNNPPDLVSTPLTRTKICRSANVGVSNFVPRSGSEDGVINGEHA